MSNTCILVTGGLGFVGSITVVELLKEGYNIVVVDDLSNSSKKIIPRLFKVSGVSEDRLKIYLNDVRDKDALEKIFTENRISGVIHFAAFKSVSESVSKPIEYYNNNLISTFVLIEVMKKHNVFKLVFSSSSTVYAGHSSDIVPFTEDLPLIFSKSPYGNTKVFTEQILQDLFTSDNRWHICLLRYFNPVGAHPSGELGEDPLGIPTNLLPCVAQVASGRLEKLYVYGNDYPTPDKTAIRDYVHVVDVALGHIAALKKLNESPAVYIYNLGKGKGCSVLEVLNAFQKATGQKIPFEYKPRRPGDVAVSWANVSKAEKELKWKALYSLEDMCSHMWKFQTQNPQGY
eukprot:TRINITY_DN152_c0_g2_i1.p1 TRINITY_DN152_c0_g2~~TRINITY_DN152_c0_g2_i1.p1  ORF type:complete len:355 (+),score=48.65 TRINITY_DN152_c0_g2_i1:31-1065(+)